MSDIVERLRTGQTDGSHLRWQVTPIHVEAADEIERLRAALRAIARDDEDTTTLLPAIRMRLIAREALGDE